MLGRAVVAALYRANHTPLPFTRQDCDISDRRDVQLRFLQQPFDAAINAAGVIPVRGRALDDLFATNAAGPHRLAAYAERRGVRLVHASTDHVFSGAADHPHRRYATTDTPVPSSLYGLSKLAGEPHVTGSTTITVRTSFVGRTHGLLAWFLEGVARGNVPMLGWRHAYWTGSTDRAVAEQLVAIATEQSATGLAHLATRRKWNKYDVLRIAARAFFPDVPERDLVKPSDEPRIDLALQPTYYLAEVDTEIARLAEQRRDTP